MSFPITELICWIVPKKDMPFLKYMDGVVFSCDVQQIKPEVDIYETLLKRYEPETGEVGISGRSGREL